MEAASAFDLIPVPPDVRPMSVVLLESPRWLVGVPLTPWAAAWWGSWTGWCTAIDDGAFHFYQRQGPLLIFRQRETSWRWQLHAATGEFRDSRNRRVSWRGFLGQYPEVSNALVAATVRGLQASEYGGSGPQAPAAGGSSGGGLRGVMRMGMAEPDARTLSPALPLNHPANKFAGTPVAGEGAKVLTGLG